LSGDVGHRILVLDVGGSESEGQQKAQCVDDEMAFAAFDFLAGVEPGADALGGAACALRIN